MRAPQSHRAGRVLYHRMSPALDRTSTQTGRGPIQALLTNCNILMTVPASRELPLRNKTGTEILLLATQQVFYAPCPCGKDGCHSVLWYGSEFGVRGYPTIKLLKGDLAYNYKGPRTKDDIVEFANRVSGPAVRALPSKQMFSHMLKRHNVLFVYVGGDSPLRYEVTLPELPAVVVFKDGGYFTYDGRSRPYRYVFSGSENWSNQRKPTQTEGEHANSTQKGRRSPGNRTQDLGWIQRVAKEYREHFNRDFQFGHIDGNDYINSLIMGEVAVPSVIILNTSNEQYFLPQEPVQSVEQLVQFISGVLNGSAQAYGGDGFIQRVKRIAFDAPIYYYVGVPQLPPARLLPVRPPAGRHQPHVLRASARPK
ncbi:hypothetical protein WMY93_029990 [Mugilogobius chulae]|uniref:protein disulfide-isomerase n=1 Tax=Mugilogobius chulae TaxID=88201 RepID=A0AAW0MQV2_9GOBI